MNSFVFGFFNFARRSERGSSTKQLHNRAEVFNGASAPSFGGKLDESTERSLINSFRQVQLLLPQPSIIQQPKRGAVVGARNEQAETDKAAGEGSTQSKAWKRVRATAKDRNMNLHATEALMFSITPAALRSFPL